MPNPTFELNIRDWAHDMRGRSPEAQVLWHWMLLYISARAKADGTLPAKATKERLCADGSLTPHKYDKALQELEDHKVFSRTPEGVIYSRRIQREANPDRQVLAKAFEKLCDHYPNATMVGPARTVWQGFIADGVITTANVHQVLEGLERWKGSRQWQEDGGKYVPSLAKWLAERKWEDRPAQHEWATMKKRLQS